MKFLRKVIESHVRRLLEEQDSLEQFGVFYPKDSLGYERAVLALAVCDLKISMWQALLGRKETHELGD